MYCRECGKQMVDGERFCRYCGTEQVAVQEATKPVINHVPNTNMPFTNTYIPQKTNNNAIGKVFVIIGGVIFSVIGLAVITMVAAFLFGGEPEPKQANKSTKKGVDEELSEEEAYYSDDSVYNTAMKKENGNSQAGLVRGVVIDDTYEMSDFQMPTDWIINHYNNQNWTGVELVDHYLKPGESEGVWFDVVTVRTYYEHPEGLYTLIHQESPHCTYSETFGGWQNSIVGYTDCESSSCDFSGFIGTYWKIDDEYTLHDINTFFDIYDYDEMGDEAYFCFEDFPETHFVFDGSMGPITSVIRGDLRKVGRIYLVSDDEIRSTDIYAGYETVGVGDEWGWSKWDSSVSISIHAYREDYYGTFVSDMFGFYVSEDMDQGPIRITKEEYEAGIKGKKIQNEDQSSTSIPSATISSGAVPGGVEDFVGSWDYGYKLLSNVEKKGDIYIYTDSFMEDAGFRICQSKIYGKYDNNKNAVFFYKVEEIVKEYNYDLEDYSEVMQDERDFTGYMYTYGDGVLYVVCGETEYNPNHDATICYRFEEY